MNCSVIIVTHNSERFLPKAMEALLHQTVPADQIIIVDSGSTNTSYLKPYASIKNVTLLLKEGDIGFCKGNNIGFQSVSKNCPYLFLVNPDLFLANNYIEKAIAFMDAHKSCAALTGITLGYDIEKREATGLYDSTGIFSTWYGRWYDRGQGKKVDPTLFQAVEEIPAICGAVFFCRRRALEDVLLHGNTILDESFYMYKEDIDLSLRLRHKGWDLLFIPSLIAHHCRGWSVNRKRMPRWSRLCSAQNEWRIHWRNRSPVKIFYSSLKWAAVRWFNR